MCYRFDSALDIIWDCFFRSIYHIIQILHEYIEHWETLCERSRNLAPFTPKVDDKARINDCLPVKVVQYMMRLYAFVGGEERYCLAKTRGAQG